MPEAADLQSVDLPIRRIYPKIVVGNGGLEPTSSLIKGQVLRQYGLHPYYFLLLLLKVAAQLLLQNLLVRFS